MLVQMDNTYVVHMQLTHAFTEVFILDRYK